VTLLAPIDLASILPLALLGAVLGLDVVGFPQAMISRPIVAATAGGAMVGSAAQGLLVGVALELIALETLPFGASRYPEWASASVVAGVLFAEHESARAGAMTIAVIAALATAWIGGGSMVVVRTLNARWARRSLAALDRGERRAVIGLQVAGLSADLVRGFLLTFIAILVMRPIMQASLEVWSVNPRVSRAVLVGVAAMVATGACWKLFHTTPGARWLFIGGLVAGLGLLFGGGFL
jgi:mannose/fructose/N-acetylgalactosamine-specific phosphotransferase system component IIC